MDEMVFVDLEDYEASMENSNSLMAPITQIVVKMEKVLETVLALAALD